MPDDFKILYGPSAFSVNLKVAENDIVDPVLSENRNGPLDQGLAIDLQQGLEVSHPRRTSSSWNDGGNRQRGHGIL
jgi:hypothetical protein